MRRVLLCGLSSLRAQSFRHSERYSLRIKERLVREAISLSLARKRPDRSFGGVTASSASSLIDGSARVYIKCAAAHLMYTHWEAAEAHAVIAFLDVLRDQIWETHGDQIAELLREASVNQVVNERQTELEFDDDPEF